MKPFLEGIIASRRDDESLKGEREKQGCHCHQFLLWWRFGRLQSTEVIAGSHCQTVRPRGIWIKGSPFLTPRDKYSFPIQVKGHQSGSWEVFPNLSWSKRGFRVTSCPHFACREVATTVQMRDPSVGDGVGGTGWATFKSLKLHLAVELFQLLCVFMQSVIKWWSALQYVTDAVCQVVPLLSTFRWQEFLRENTSNSFKTFLLFNPAIFSRNRTYMHTRITVSIVAKLTWRHQVDR